MRNPTLSLVFFLLLCVQILQVNGDIAPPSLFAPMSTTVQGCVDVVSGNFVVQEADIVVRGVEPIPIYRVYDGSEWRICCERFRVREGHPSVWLEEMDGGQLAFSCGAGVFERVRSIWLGPLPAPSPRPLSGRVDRGNYSVEWSGENQEVTLTTGSGERRVYRSVGHKSRFYLTKLTRPNGNHLIFHYNSGRRLAKIEALDSSEQVLLGWACFSYVWSGEELRCEVTTSDERCLTYVYLKGRLGRVECAGSVLERIYYDDEGHLLARGVLGRGYVSVCHYWGGDRPKGQPKIKVSHGRSDLRHGRIKRLLLPAVRGQHMVPVASFLYDAKKDRLDEMISLTIEVSETSGPRSVYKLDERGRIVCHEQWAEEELLRRFDLEWEGRRLTAFKQGRSAQYFQYDKRGNVVEETMPGGWVPWGEDIPRKRTFTYSEDGRNLVLSATEGRRHVEYQYGEGTDLLVEKRIFEDGEEAICERFAYDAFGALISHVSEDRGLRRETRIQRRQEWPAFGLPEVIEKFCGEGELLERRVLHYSEQALVVREDVCDANGELRYSLCKSYDELGRLVSQTDPIGQETIFEYDERGFLVCEGGPLGETFFRYNRQSLLAEKEFGGREFSYRYDQLGRLVSETDDLGNETTHTVDALGRRIETHFPDGSCLRRSFDSADRLTTETNALGETTKFLWSAHGNLVYVGYPDGKRRWFAYDSEGHLVNVLSCNGLRTQITRDTRGHALVDERGARRVYCGDLLLEETDPEGHTVRYSYDRAGRLVCRQGPLSCVTLEYDALGRVSRQTSESQSLEWEYDLLGRTIEERVRDGEDNLQSREWYGYDAANHKTSQSAYDSEGRLYESRWRYNPFGELEEAVDPLGCAITYDYRRDPECPDGPLRRVVMVDPAGHKITFGYRREFGWFDRPVRQVVATDSLGRGEIVALDPSGRELTRTTRGSGGEVVAASRTGYDCCGRRTHQTHVVYSEGAPVREVTTEWIYGPGGRLEKLVEAAKSESPRATHYKYDAHGQLVTTVRPSGVEHHCEYDIWGRLERFWGPDFDYRYAYDANDNLLSIEDFEGRRLERSYDGEGNMVFERLCNGLELSYRYDDLGQRVEALFPDGSAMRCRFDGILLRDVIRVDASGGERYRHSYVDHDPSGRVTGMWSSLSGREVRLSWDALGRCTSVRTRGYSAEAPEFDVGGDLLRCSLRDPWGQSDQHFHYDALHQLQSEGGVADHSYRFDSVHNRISFDGVPASMNALNQPVGCDYDLDGRLLRLDVNGHGGSTQ